MTIILDRIRSFFLLLLGKSFEFDEFVDLDLCLRKRGPCSSVDITFYNDKEKLENSGDFQQLI